MPTGNALASVFPVMAFSVTIFAFVALATLFTVTLLVLPFPFVTVNVALLPVTPFTYVVSICCPRLSCVALVALAALDAEGTAFHVPSPAKKWLALPSLFGASPFALVDTTAVLALPFHVFFQYPLQICVLRPE